MNPKNEAEKTLSEIVKKFSEIEKILKEFRGFNPAQARGADGRWGSSTMSVGITNAVNQAQVDALKDSLTDEEYKRLSELAALTEKGKELYKKGKFDEAQALFKQVLYEASQRLQGLFSDLPEIRVSVRETVGNFDYIEPTIDYTVVDTDHHGQEIRDRLRKICKEWGQDAVHVSILYNHLPKGETFGVDRHDGSRFEPDVEFTTHHKLTEHDYKTWEDAIHNSQLAGSTRTSNGVLMYNVSQYGVSADDFGRATVNASEKLKKFNVTPITKARKLWIITP